MSSLTRRRFLQGLGGAWVGLPLLMNRAHAAAPAPRHFVLLWENGGTISPRCGEAPCGAMHLWNDWAPTGPTEAPILGPLHQDLLGYRDRLLFVSGVDNYAELADHGPADIGALTARAVRFRPGGLDATGPSIDQVLGHRLARRDRVPYPTIDLALDGDRLAEPSHRAAGEPIGRALDPVAAFDRLFQPGVGAGPKARARRRSVLDGVAEGFRLLEAQVGAEDRRVLEAHRDHLRTLERRLAHWDAEACGVPPTGAVQAELHIDLMVQALACGLTHVVTLHHPDTIDPAAPRPYDALDPQTDGHALGHLALDLGDPTGQRAVAWRAQMQANRRHRLRLMKRLLDGLTDAGLIDDTVVLHLSEFSNAAAHTARDLPILLAVPSGGALRPGRHVALADPGPDYATPWSVHNLHTSLLQTFGFEDPHFGDDSAPRSGPLPLD